MVLAGELRIISASRSSCETLRVPPVQTEHRMFCEIGEKQWDIPALRQLLEDILPKETQPRDYRAEHDFPGVGHKVLVLSARQMAGKDEQPPLILLAN